MIFSCSGCGCWEGAEHLLECPVLMGKRNIANPTDFFPLSDSAWPPLAEIDADELLTPLPAGVIVSFSLTCGTCGTIGSWVSLRYCTACNDAICSTCFPPGQEKHYAWRCARCIASNKPAHPAISTIGERMAMRIEEQVLKVFLGLDDTQHDCDESIMVPAPRPVE
jgi:hypothetical protein